MGLSKESFSFLAFRAQLQPTDSCSYLSVMVCNSWARISLANSACGLISGIDGFAVALEVTRWHQRVVQGTARVAQIPPTKSNTSQDCSQTKAASTERTWEPSPACTCTWNTGIFVFLPMEKSWHSLSGSHCRNFHSTSKIASIQGFLPHKRRGAGEQAEVPWNEGEVLDLNP